MVAVKFDARSVAQALKARAKAAERALSGRVLSDCEPFVPYDTGALSQSGVVGEGVIVYDVPYAQVVYHGAGMRFQTEKHPLATAAWFEAAKAAHAAEWVRAAGEAFK